MEMVAVMSIMILIAGIGFASFTFMDEKDPFQESAQRLTQMSKFALNAAMIQHRGMTIRFDKRGFEVLGSGVPDGSRYDLPNDVEIKIRRWGGKDWIKAEGQTWQFGEQGICEPLKVRFELGEQSLEMNYHALTGAPIEG